MASTCSIILWLVGVCLLTASNVFDWGKFIALRENNQKIDSTGNSTGNSTTWNSTTGTPLTWNSTTRNSTTWNSTTGNSTGNSTTGNSTTGNSTTGNSTTGNSTTWNSTTGNSTTGNSTGIESCDLALDKYHWIFMSFVIGKMISGIFEYAFGGLSLCEENENNNGYDTASLICNNLTTLFQTLDLLLLVLFSYHCLADDKIHRVRALISDETDDFVAGISGTVGLIFNLVIKKNTVTIFKAFWDIILYYCGREYKYRESDGLQDTSTHHTVLTWVSVLLIFVCIGLAIALAIKLAKKL